MAKRRPAGRSSVRNADSFDTDLGQAGEIHQTALQETDVLTTQQGVPVSDDQNTLFFPGDCQDILIGKARRIIARNGRNVMAKVAKVGNKSKVSALVEKEFHRAASERTPLGGFGETSLPVTIACA